MKNILKLIIIGIILGFFYHLAKQCTSTEIKPNKGIIESQKDSINNYKSYVDSLELEILSINLEILRAEIKEPVMITGSGYRTKSHNDKVGGAKNSQHLTASGADINAKNYTPKDLAKVIERLIKEGKMVQGGIGVYKGFVHYDIRGTKARW
jgi:uncharacterized protein YcbK (DUF882 family)